MMYLWGKRPEKSWRLPRTGRVKRALRGQDTFDEEQQALYDALLKTADTDDEGIVLVSPYVPGARVGACTTNAIDSAVRIRLVDREGYVLRGRQQSAELLWVQIRSEILRCSVDLHEFNCVDYARTHGKRKRQGRRCPLHKEGILLKPRKQMGDDDEG